MSEDAEEAEDQEPPKKGGKMLLIVGLVVGLALGGGGAFFFLSSADDGAQAEVAVEPEPVEEEPEPELAYVQINRMPATLLGKDGELLGYVFFDLAIEVEGEEDQSFVSSRVPHLREAFLREFAAAPITRADRPGAIDFDGVKERLMAQARHVVSGDRIRDIRVVQTVRM